MSLVTRFDAARFDRLYAADADPWDYGSSGYEREKYARTLAALPAGCVGRALEVGCSIGVFTEQLAPRCDALVAIDFSTRALERARERLRARSNVTLAQASFPEQAPSGPWDLVVCSEILYYLDRPSLTWAIAWLAAQLHAGAVVLACSWRGGGRDEPFSGEEVHARLRRALARWHVLHDPQPGYVLDRFDADGG